MTESVSRQLFTQHYVDEDRKIRHFIKQEYKATFNAEIQVTFPHLIALQNSSGQTLSAIGYRDGQAPFFVEHYFGGPAEDTLSKLLGHSVNRDQIVELGNLAATSRRHTIALLQKTWSALHSLGFRYVVFSGTRSVMGLFKSLPYKLIANAEPEAVPMEDDWGSYYSHQPIVICAKLNDYDQRFGFCSNTKTQCVRHLRYAEIMS